ncbi:MAG: RNA 2',3'-cyclic phosphodiesterase [Hyphomonadaceae bacterium]
MSLRLFAALSVPDHIAARLMALQKGVSGAQWRPRENLHLTLRFFGDVEEPAADDLDAALAEAALRAPPFDLALKGVGVFGKEAPHTLWVGAAANPALEALAAACERAARRAGLKPEPRKFTPHVTLAYLRNPDRARLISFEQRLALFESAPWRVSEFSLFSSQVRRNAPSLYRVEADYPLG